VSTPPTPPRRRAAPGAPAARPATWHRPADISRELSTLLHTHGLTRIYWSACTLLAVISVAPGLTVWTNGHHLTWTRHGTQTTWAAHDTHRAAEHLARLARLARQPAPPRGDTP
jgi:hypothetical protein